MSIRDRFATLIDRISPSEANIAVFEGHRETVTRKLRDQYGEVRVALVGSFQRGSAVSQMSDYDLLFNLPKASATWGGKLISSTRALQNLRDVLQDRYVSTDIGRDGQAVVVHFGGGAYPVDVVPGVYHSAHPSSHYPMYLIPDGAGDWMLTSPDYHNKYIDQADSTSVGKLKYASKLLKFWRGCREPRIQLSSFHIELLLAMEGTCAGVKSYPECIRDSFRLLASRQCRALQDPLGISGWVKASGTEAKRDQAINAIVASADRADRAIDAEEWGRQEEAARLWDIVFNGNFPKR